MNTTLISVTTILVNYKTSWLPTVACVYMLTRKAYLNFSACALYVTAMTFKMVVVGITSFVIK